MEKSNHTFNAEQAKQKADNLGDLLLRFRGGQL